MVGVSACVSKRSNIVPSPLIGASRQYTSVPAASDSFLWLEEVNGKEAMDWVNAHNAPTLKALKEGPFFQKVEPELRKIVLAKDRVPTPSIVNGMIYNFWQDEVNVRGVWRRTTMDEYKKTNPNWETILDIDQLAKQENENWVYNGGACLAPKFDRCILSLSRAGKDATVRREFDVSTKSFVKDGFYLPEAKSSVDWIDQDTLYVGTDFGPESLTQSGYPRTVRIWKRGQSLEQSRQVFAGLDTDLRVSAWVGQNEAGEKFHFFSKFPSFFEEELHWVGNSAEIQFGESPKTGKVDLPGDVSVQGIYKDLLIFQLRSEWKLGKISHPQGAVLSAKISEISKPALEWKSISEIYRPTKTGAMEFVAIIRGGILISELNHAKSRVFRYQNSGSKWNRELLAMPATGSISLVSGSIYEKETILSYADFLTPTSYYLLNLKESTKKKTLLKQSPARFESKGLVIEQFFAKSKDGTAVPYFLVAKKGLVKNGKNPTLLYGYGGFENSETPYYSGSIGKIWLNQGGVYVLANIRGGGEYGPAWHQAALKEKRQNAYDDFIAIAEDLIAKKITSPRNLGIQGGSNGGLLMGVMLTQRPDLFNAIICQVPLLDMLRYNKLLAGASWMGEYGNPDIPEEREYIQKYSPYQNLSSDKKYPEIFFTGSTADDRVHPGHMRKMAAKMESMGKLFYYYENTEGGHGGAANLEQIILVSSLEWSYLLQKLR